MIRVVSITSIEIHFPAQCLARVIRPQVLDEQLHHHRRRSRRRAVPRQQQAPGRPERVALRQRLLTADIDHRPRQMPFLQGFHQVSIDHRHPAPGVDEQARRLELPEQRGVVQVMGRRRVRQQVDHVIHFTHQARQVCQRGHFGKRGLYPGFAGDAIQLDPERQQKLRDGLANIAGADDQHLAPRQALALTAVPFALDLADQARQHFTFVAEHVGQHVFGHDLTENPHRARQAIVPCQPVGQQWRDTGPGRLQPLRLVALTQQGGQQVRLAQPDRAIGGLTGQFGGVTAGEHFQFRRGLAQQLGVYSVVVFGNQNAHGSNLSKAVQTAAGEVSLPGLAIAKIIPVFHADSEQSLSAGQTGSLRRNNSSGKCSMYSSSAGGICRW
ncbi:hypothetical protein EMIT0P12_21046 [Pseudomonas sp. IT-P12]